MDHNYGQRTPSPQPEEEGFIDDILPEENNIPDLGDIEMEINIEEQNNNEMIVDDDLIVNHLGLDLFDEETRHILNDIHGNQLEQQKEEQEDQELDEILSPISLPLNEDEYNDLQRIRFEEHQLEQMPQLEPQVGLQQNPQLMPQQMPQLIPQPVPQQLRPYGRGLGKPNDMIGRRGYIGGRGKGKARGKGHSEGPLTAQLHPPPSPPPAPFNARRGRDRGRGRAHGRGVPPVQPVLPIEPVDFEQPVLPEIEEEVIYDWVIPPEEVNIENEYNQQEEDNIQELGDLLREGNLPELDDLLEKANLQQLDNLQEEINLGQLGPLQERDNLGEMDDINMEVNINEDDHGEMLANDHLRSPLQRPQSPQAEPPIDLAQPPSIRPIEHPVGPIRGREATSLERDVITQQEVPPVRDSQTSTTRPTFITYQSGRFIYGRRADPSERGVNTTEKDFNQPATSRVTVHSHPVERPILGRRTAEEANIDDSGASTSRETGSSYPVERHIFGRRTTEVADIDSSGASTSRAIGHSYPVERPIRGRQFVPSVRDVNPQQEVGIPSPKRQKSSPDRAVRGRAGTGNQQIRHPAPRVPPTSTVSVPPPEDAAEDQEEVAAGVSGAEGVRVAAVEVVGQDVGLAAGQDVGVGAEQVVGFDDHDVNYLGNLRGALGSYELHHLIATGSYGTVVRGTRLLNNTPCAIKILKPEVLNSTEQSINNEVNDVLLFIQERLNTHENIVAIYHIVMNPNPNNMGRYIVMELAVGNLYTLITNPTEWQTMNEHYSRYMMTGIANALVELHVRGVVHCDIRPENIVLIDRQGQQPSIPEIAVSQFIPKLCDFSKSQRRQRGSTAPQQLMATQRIADIHYSAPEARYGNPNQVVVAYNLMKADVYSLGCTLLACLIGGHPFVPTDVQNRTDHEIYRLKNTMIVTYMIDGFNLTQNLKHLLKQTLRESTTTRFTAKKFKGHQWFQ